MTREEIIDGLQYTIDMFCFNPSTGEVTDKNRLNDESRLTVDACEGAIEIIKALEQQPCGNAIDRAEAIKIASGYCHPANIAKELAKLPSVNPQPCGDAISRQAVLDGLASIAKVKAKSDAQKSLMGRVMFFVEQLPPVTPQPKIGHWIKRDGYWECSECHAERAYGNEYCPDCGSHNGDIAKPYKEGEVEE